jgi:hypothetical protein
VVGEAIISATYRQVRECGMDLLSGPVSAVCFVPVPTARMSHGVRIACIALAGTVGALGMLGHRRGGITELFAAAGRLVTPGAPESAAVLLGLAIHVIWIALWSALLAAFTQPDRRSRTSIAAVIVAALALAASLVVSAVVVGPLGTLSLAARTVAHVVLAVSFIIGMRLAPQG